MENNFNKDFDLRGLIPIKDYNAILDISLIRQNVVIAEPDTVFEIVGALAFTKKSITLLTAKPKAGKTTTSSWIVAQAINQSIKVVWFDTEQGQHYSSRTQDWILKTSGLISSDYLKYYNLKTHNTEDRIKLIEIEIQRSKPDFIVIDGVRDLVYDINSTYETTTLITILMQWAENYNCHILTILHQNKNDGQARGHLGSELVNKSETVIKISLTSTGLITVEPEHTRGKPFEPFALRRDESGMPKLEDNFQYQKKTMVSRIAVAPITFTKERHQEVINTAFELNSALSYTELINKIIEGFKIGVSKAKIFYQYYLREGMVNKDEKAKTNLKYTNGLTTKLG